MRRKRAYSGDVGDTTGARNTRNTRNIGDTIELPDGHAGASDNGQGQGQANFVLDLRQLVRGDLDIAGGKGANLGELIRAGFPVPAGFVVTTAAYDHFVEQHSLSETIAQALHAEQ